MATTVVRRLYFYAAAFIGVQLLAGGARDLLGVLLEQLFEPAVPGAPAYEVVQLSASAALVLVGLPLWAFHWSVAQRNARRPDEQHARLRRLYCYAVLLVAALSALFALRTVLGLLLSGSTPDPIGGRIATAIATLVVYVPLWMYHWRVVSADRSVVEASGGTATLRRWYLVIALTIGLGIGAYAAVDLLHQLLFLALAPTIGSTAGIEWAAATLIAGLALWLPHQLWAHQLVRFITPLHAEELRSTLRQVYLALVITATAVAALGSLATLLYAVLLAAFGGAAWSSLLADNTRPLAVTLIAPLLWHYHRQQLADEARRSAQEARGATARRIIGYLMAAIGLGALYFGAGGLMSTLLRMELAPTVLGASWREPLSLYLALTLVALPVYSIAAQTMEQWARQSAAEERALARRIYLYAALLFGLIASVSTAVLLLRLVIRAVLGAADPDLPAEVGRWLGYTLIGAAIAVYHTALLRRVSAARSDLGRGVTVAILADDPLRPALVAACVRELPGATLRVAGIAELASALAALAQADALIVPLAAVLEDPLRGAIRAFHGQRLLLAGPIPGYELIGAHEGEAGLARRAAQALRASLSRAQQLAPSPTPRAA
jgi:hypothetical protein